VAEHGPANLRRQVFQLTGADLNTFPAWEFALDEVGFEGQDEATVRPYLKIPVDPGDGMLVVRAKFWLADGTHATGIVSPPPPMLAGDISNHQPAMITERGHVGFYFGIFAPTAAQIGELLGTLGKSAAEVFPLRYEADVDIVGGRVAGVVPGFCYMKRGKSLLDGLIDIVKI